MPAYISEINYGAVVNFDFVEVAVTAGTDMSAYSVVIYEDTGAVTATLCLGSAVNTIAGKDVYLVDNSTTGFPGFGNKDAIALVDDLGNVLQFVSFKGATVTATEGPANGQTSTSIGETSTGESLETYDQGASYSPQAAENPGTIPCYAPGTLIDTPDGPRAVEALQVGDLVDTLDHGVLPIRWVHSGEQPLGDAAPGGFPVLIRAGAFGPGCPARDLIVSPQHRILVGGCGQLDGVFEAQVFAPAKALTGLPRIRAMTGKRHIEWIHFALDSHEVVTAEGCLSESLLLGPMVLNGLSRRERRALTHRFGPPPSPGAALNGPPARDCLSVGEVRRAFVSGPSRHRFRRGLKPLGASVDTAAVGRRSLDSDVFANTAATQP